MSEAVTKAAQRREPTARHTLALLAVASLVALVWLPRAAGAQVSQPPPNECSHARTGVVVKLSQTEDRAAANMLAEALRANGEARCLVDAFVSNARSTVAGLRTVYVVGGSRAISDPHMRNTLGRSSYTRIWGHDRWQTQSEVAEAILTIADGGIPRATTMSLRPTTYTNDCQNTAVLVKLEQREDRAAANMLAEAIRIDGDGRCLVGAFSSSARSAVSGRSVCIVGGVAAISNARVTQIGLDPSSVVRVAGADRWATQAEVAEAILSDLRCDSASSENSAHLTIQNIVEDAATAFEGLPLSTDRTDLTIRVYYCGVDTSKSDVVKNRVANLRNAFADSDLNGQLENNNHSLRFEWGGDIVPSLEEGDAWRDVRLGYSKGRKVAGFKYVMDEDRYCWPAIESDKRYPDATPLTSLIVTDVDTDGVGGFSILGDGPSYMLPQRSDDTFQIVALHEVIHTVYELWHVWGRDNKAKCNTHNLDEHDKRSVLSYAKSADSDGCDRNPILSISYLACGMLMTDANKVDDPYFQSPHRHSDFINVEYNSDYHYRYGGLDFYDTRQECIDDNSGKGRQDTTARPTRKPQPSGAVTISWGGDATQQRGTGGQIFCASAHGYPAPYTCRNLRYVADRDILGEPYEADGRTPRWNLTCGIDNLAYRPFYWVGDSSTGCLYYAAQLGKSTYRVWVEINGFRSNELTWPPTSPECDPSQGCYEDDNPELSDADESLEEYSWFQPDGDIQNTGYDHDWWYTYAWGNSDATDNWALWKFAGVKPGRYSVRVHVPTAVGWSTAHCQYVIRQDGNRVATEPLNQQGLSGWVSIGTYNLSGSVHVEVRDNDCLEDHRVVELENARFAADAIRLVAR